MVEGLLENEQWQKHFAPRTTIHNIHRCFQARVGGTFKSSKNRVSMDWGRKGRYTHKYAGIKSSFSCFASFSSSTKTAAHTVWQRQQNSSDLHQQTGGNPFTSSDISSLRDVEFCSRQKLNLVSSVCSRRGKSHCRQEVKGVPGQHGMDAASSSVSGIAKRSWLLRYRSLCNTCEPPGFAFSVSWRPEPGAAATDAFNVKWDFQLAYHPFCMIKRCLKKIEQDQSHCVLITPV